MVTIDRGSCVCVYVYIRACVCLCVCTPFCTPPWKYTHTNTHKLRVYTNTHKLRLYTNTHKLRLYTNTHKLRLYTNTHNLRLYTNFVCTQTHTNFVCTPFSTPPLLPLLSLSFFSLSFFSLCFFSLSFFSLSFFSLSFFFFSLSFSHSPPHLLLQCDSRNKALAKILRSQRHITPKKQNCIITNIQSSFEILRSQTFTKQHCIKQILSTFENETC